MLNVWKREEAEHKTATKEKCRMEIESCSVILTKRDLGPALIMQNNRPRTLFQYVDLPHCCNLTAFGLRNEKLVD